MYSTRKINHEYLMEILNQETIFEYYLQIRVVYNENICNPLRVDHNPTCSFFWSGDKLYFRDYAWRTFDFLNVVQYLFKLGYNDACKRIYNDLVDKSRELEAVVIKPIIKVPTKIEVKRRNWNDDDLKYWNKFGIDLETLQKYNISPIEHYWINGEHRRVNERCYCYHFGGYNYKLYFPDRNKNQLRFIQNKGNLIFGLDQLPDFCPYIVITKSAKDTMCLNILGIYSISFSNETYIPNEEQLKLIKKKSKNLFSLYDFDYSGVKTANKLKKLYNIPYFFFTKNQKKDVSDNYAYFGKEYMLNLIKQIKQDEKIISKLFTRNYG